MNKTGLILSSFALGLSLVPALFSDDVKIGFGTQLPPYVIRESETFQNKELPPYLIPESGAGMEFEIVDKALAEAGHKLVPVFLRQENIKEEIKANPVDGLCPCDENMGIEKTFFSNSHISYQNAAMVSKKSNFKISSVSDLEGKKIFAFQNAKLYLGEDFKKIVGSNTEYQEIPLRGRHMGIAMNTPDAVIIMDKNIFEYYLAQYIFLDTGNCEFTVSEIFPENDYKVAFFNEKLRDDFNGGLAKLKKSGKYGNILEKYKNLLQKRIEVAKEKKMKTSIF
jgi:polar amino acid transport system substrate-binding protein